MKRFGIIHKINLNTQIFSIESSRGLDFFYIPKNIFKRLKRYLYEGNYVSFISNDVLTLKNRKYYYEIKYFTEISVPGRRYKEKLYSKNDNTIDLKKMIDNIDNIMFIDLEMSMPPYERASFQPELIQASYIIMNKNLEELEKRDFHIIPTIAENLTKRTEDFLHITYDYLKENGVLYNDFYNAFKDDLNRYNPTVVIFGKNDKSFLESSYKVNNVDSLNKLIRFVNLNQLLKNHFELTADPGLFKSYEMLYNEDLPPQKHDAYEDAYYTYMVYKKFKEIVDLSK